MDFDQMFGEHFKDIQTSTVAEFIMTFTMFHGFNTNTIAQILSKMPPNCDLSKVPDDLIEKMLTTSLVPTYILVSGGHDGNLKFWKEGRSTPTLIYKCDHAINSIWISRHANYICTQSFDSFHKIDFEHIPKEAIRGALATPEYKRKFKFTMQPDAQIIISPDARYIFYSVDRSILNFYAIFILDTIEGSANLFVEVNSQILAICMSLHNESIAFGCSDGKIGIVNLRTKQVTYHDRSFNGHSKSLSWSDNGRYLAHGINNNSIFVFDFQINAGFIIKTNAAVTCIIFSPDSKLLFAGDREGYVKIWNMMNTNPIFEYKEKGEITCIAYLPDTESVAFGNIRSAEIKIMNIAGDHKNHILLSQTISVNDLKILRVYDPKLFNQIRSKLSSKQMRLVKNTINNLK